MTKNRSLRRDLAVSGFVALVLPMLVLLIVVLTAESSVEVVPEGTTEISGGAVTSPWALGTALLLLLPVGALAWWWSGKAVRPIQEIVTVVNEIEGDSLDKRIHLVDGPREVQEMADTFDRMLDRVERSTEDQRQFVEDTSHSLRTPLAALVGDLELLERQVVTDAELERVRHAREQADRLSESLAGLLGEARVRRESTRQIDNDLAEIVVRVAEQQRIATPKCRVETDVPERLLLGIDGPSVERALTALIENAVRHGGPHTRVTVAVEVADGGTQLSISDDGPGIPVESQKQLFERYHRSETSEGDGIGLAIVKQVADAYGGVDVTSPLEDGRGTRFTLSLPGPDV